MKKLSLLLLAFAFVLNANATHIAGSSITLQYAGTPNTYIIKGYLYRDCAGINAPNTMSINYFDSAGIGSPSFNISLPKVNQTIIPTFTCVPLLPFNCTLGSGLEVFEYADTLVLPNASSDWRFWYSDCCRNLSGNISNSNGTFFCEARLDNLNFPTNSLPDFSSLDAPLFCLNNPSVFLNTTIEPDGDSVVYTLNPALENSVSGFNPVPCTYVFPYSPTQFLASSVPVTIDPQSGVVAFTPTMIQRAVVVVQANEYRNGILIGMTMRDLSVMIVNGISNPSLIGGNVFLDLNGNGVKDGLDYNVANEFVQSTPFYAYNVTDTAGNYSMYIGTGAHTVEIANVPSWFNVNPASYGFNFSTAGNVSNSNDFAITPIPGTTDLEVSMSLQRLRPLVNTSGNFHIRNIGSDIVSGTLTFNLPTGVDLTSSSIVPFSYVGNTVTWNIPSILPLASFNIQMTLMADSTLMAGDSVYFSSSLIATPGTDVNPNNNVSNGWVSVMNSYDPNIKTSFPAGTMSLTAVQNSHPITYRIDFENTGTANALTVRVTDVLPAELKLETIEIIGASHTYSTKINYPRELEFTFNNINLTPNAVDSVLSKGYILLKVTPKSNLALGTIITNEANIYFDNNAPILTPLSEIVIVTSNTTTLHEIKNNSTASLIMYPNPANEQLHVLLPNDESGTFQMSIYTVDGKLVQLNRVNVKSATPHVLNIAELKPGSYISILSKGKEAWSGRFVKP